MPRFSANLGFLWADLELSDAVRAAANAGFDAVECHWPYDTSPTVLKQVLADVGLPFLGLNTSLGDPSQNEFGLSALPDREKDAKAAIDQAVDYALSVGAEAVHVMAGRARGVEAHKVFVENLRYACDRARGSVILIEPINHVDVPGYFLSDTRQALSILEEVGADNLKLMFDCYHVGKSGGDVMSELCFCLPFIGHIQFASIPDRGPPEGAFYSEIFEELDRLGWSRPLGAEYRVDGETALSLDWMTRFR